MRVRWEYELLVMHIHGARGLFILQNQLNAKGREGGRVVAVLSAREVICHMRNHPARLDRHREYSLRRPNKEAVRIAGAVASFLALALLFEGAREAEAQVAAAVVVASPDGKLHLDQNGQGVFAVLAINLGKPGGNPIPGTDPPQYCGSLGVHATGGLLMSVCLLNTATGSCIPGSTLLFGQVVQLQTTEVGVYGILVQGPVPSGRVTVIFEEFSKPVATDPPRCEEGGPSTFVAERGAVSIAVE